MPEMGNTGEPVASRKSVRSGSLSQSLFGGLGGG